MPTATTKLSSDLEDGFWARVEKGPICWLWKGPVNEKGYGQVKVYAHHLAYQLVKGRIPEEKVLMHTCDNPKCVKPEHLVLGTQSENSLDMHAKGRARFKPFPNGEANHAAKLTARQVREIRRRYRYNSYGSRKLAREYGVRRETVQKIIQRKTWRQE